jgi:phage terminase large subunit
MTGQTRKYINTFSPLQWQIEPWKCQDPIMLLTGSAGGGKSRVAGEKLHGYCKRYPNAMALMIRKTRNSMTNSTTLFMDRTVIGQDPQVTHYSSKSRFEYSNGSILAYGGMANEDQREQIRSIGQDGALDIVWMEEAHKFTESDFNEILARMRGKSASWMQVMLSTNPDAPTHWIYQRLIKGLQAKVFYSGALDNEHNPKEYINNLALLTGILKQRLVEGKWVQAEGVVYEGFRTDTHVIDRFEIPKDWIRFRAVDFGYTNPMVVQWWAVDPDGRMYLYREIYKTNLLVEDAAQQIKELSKDEKIITTVCDHDAEDRATLEKHGIPTQRAKKAVNLGIQAVERRLRKAGDGKPRLFLFNDALVEIDRKLENNKKPTCLIDEMPAYIWPVSKSGRALKEEPVKDNDHSCDAMRYSVMYREHSGIYIG